MVELLLIHVLTLSVAEEMPQILVFTIIELTTSVLVGVRAYLLDHSGDKGTKYKPRCVCLSSFTKFSGEHRHQNYGMACGSPPSVRRSE